jgi:uncharacterized protein (UPF0335 family)
MSSSTTTQQQQNNNNSNNPSSDKTIERIQAECAAMIKTLKNLEHEENDLQCQLDILSREAMLCGYQNDMVEPSIRTRKTNRKKKTGGGPEEDQEDDD